MSLFFVPAEALSNARVVKGGTGCPDSGVYVGTIRRIVANSRTKTPGNFDAFVSVPGYDYDKLSFLISVAYDGDGNLIDEVAAKESGRNNSVFTIGAHTGMSEQDMQENGVSDEDLVDQDIGIWVESYYSEDGEVALYGNIKKTLSVEDAEKMIAEGVEVPRHKAPARDNGSGGSSDDGARARTRTRTAPAAEEPPAERTRRRAAPEPEPEPEPEVEEPRTRVRRRRPPPQ